MKDFELYQQILGLVKPWQVKQVTLQPESGEVEVEVECLESVWGCPQCQQRMQIQDWERRRWRHLDSCQFKTIIVAEVPRVKCAEHRTLSEGGDDRLAGSRFTWLYGWENQPDKQQARWESLSQERLQTARAWRIKESFRWFWWLPDRDTAKTYFGQWYGWAIRSRLEPVKKVARMLQRHLERILNFFDHRLTNGPIEGLNNKIQGLIKKAYGLPDSARQEITFTYNPDRATP